MKQYTKSAPLKWINVNKWKPWRAIIECRLLSNYSMPHKNKQKNRIKWILLEHSSTFGNQSTFMSAVDSFAVLLCLFFLFFILTRYDIDSEYGHTCTMSFALLYLCRTPEWLISIAATTTTSVIVAATYFTKSHIRWSEIEHTKRYTKPEKKKTHTSNSKQNL